MHLYSPLSAAAGGRSVVGVLHVCAIFGSTSTQLVKLRQKHHVMPGAETKRSLNNTNISITFKSTKVSMLVKGCPFKHLRQLIKLLGWFFSKKLIVITVGLPATSVRARSSGSRNIVDG